MGNCNLLNVNLFLIYHCTVLLQTSLKFMKRNNPFACALCCFFFFLNTGDVTIMQLFTGGFFFFFLIILHGMDLRCSVLLDILQITIDFTLLL